jgi:undecaprenyl-diphosphatase
VSVSDERHLIVLLVLGTLPAVMLGFAFEKWLRHLFGSPVAAALFLVINGGVLFVGERLRRQANAVGDRRKLAQAGWREALLVGLFQATALVPGISRSGATIVGGLLVGLRHEEPHGFHSCSRPQSSSARLSSKSRSYFTPPPKPVPPRSAGAGCG